MSGMDNAEASSRVLQKERIYLDYSKIRYFVFDIDGTLVTKEKKISPATKQAVLRLLDKGYRVSIASGRRIGGFRRYAKELGFADDATLIGMNGGQIETMCGTPIYKAPLEDKGDLADYVDFWLDYPVILVYYFADHLVSLNLQDDEVGKNFLHTLLERAEVASVESARDPREIEGLPLKVLTYGDPDIILEAIQKMPDRFADCFSQVLSEPFFFEIMRKGTSKGNGVEKAAQALSLSMDRVMTFGDQNNDLSMIRQAGIGVAMGNACPELKEAADVVIGTNEEDGIAHFLEEAGFLD